MFGRAAIRLGIGPHSSFFTSLHCKHCDMLWYKLLKIVISKLIAVMHYYRN